ncbi:hypothetical protein [Marinovum sp.]|uniref:hypothetical protein n=1 Tax=Marinovum sp. TaxID=2024839 RepID=UPI002B27225B|nr:hypothetical protein [Marinovum sp.]
MDVLIFGDGPAARLAAIALAGLGLRVVRALPRPGLGPPPTTRHTHVVARTVLPSAAAIDAGLAQEITARIAPDCLWRQLTGDGCTEYTEPHISRAAIDSALAVCLARRPLEAWRDVTLTGRCGTRLSARSAAGAGVFDLVIDATGAHRATRAMLAPFAPAARLEDDGPVRLYQTYELALPAPQPLLHWSGPAVEGPTRALYGDFDGRRMRITAALGRGAPRIATLDDVARAVHPQVAALIPKGARLVRRTATIAPNYRRLRVPEAEMPNWIALGDARSQWPPRLGTGLSALFRQCRILQETLAGGGTPQEARTAIDTWLDTEWDKQMTLSAHLR